MRIALLAGLAAIANGCGGRPREPGGTPGEFHAGTFAYCDAQCGPIPELIAVGTTFSFEFSSEDVDLASSDPDKLEETSLTPGQPHIASFEEYASVYAEFRALASGVVNIEARAVPGGEVVDYVTVSLVEIDRLGLFSCDRAFNAIGRYYYKSFGIRDCVPLTGPETTQVVIARGQSLAPTFCALAFDAEGTPLGGRFDMSWATSPESEAALQIYVGSDPRCATIGGLTLGQATLIVTFETHSVQLDVTVEP